MGSNSAPLRFGVELEFLLGGRKKKFASWKALADDVSKRLRKAGIHNHVNHGRDALASETYREWSIVQEVTISNDLDNHLFGIELVSPIYPADWNWAGDLATIFRTVDGAYNIVASPDCSTHVHVSTTPTPLPELSVVYLAEAVLYYEQALDTLMPPQRQGSSYWCRSNRESHMFSAAGTDPAAVAAAAAHSSVAVQSGDVRDLATCLGVVRYGYDEAAFSMAEAVNLMPANCTYGRSHGKKRDFVHGKLFKWNFGRLQAVAKKSASSSSAFHGTVEFRQPPGSVAADEACAWVTLALAFVAGVTAGDGSLGAGVNGASFSELWQLLQTGALELGWNDLGELDKMYGASSSGSDN